MLRGRYRLRFLVKAERADKIQDYISGWLAHVKIPKAIRVLIDIDPYHFS
jgi:primosomal protein N' (replication factor Y)